MYDHSDGPRGGMSIPTFVQVVLIALKLIDVIHWSWLWVLSPTWIGFGITLLVTVISAGKESAAEMKNPTRSIDLSNCHLGRKVLDDGYDDFDDELDDDIFSEDEDEVDDWDDDLDDESDHNQKTG